MQQWVNISAQKHKPKHVLLNDLIVCFWLDYEWKKLFSGDILQFKTCEDGLEILPVMSVKLKGGGYGPGGPGGPGGPLGSGGPQSTITSWRRINIVIRKTFRS